MAIKNFSIVGALGLLVGILGVIGPIAWDYYKTKSEIELRLIEHSPIVEKSKKLDGLRITYAGEEIEQLLRLTFSIQNIGRTPILKKDVVSPIYVQLAAAADIIEAKLLEKSPSNMDASISFSKANGRITVDFSLLNPGDKINVAVLTKSADTSFDAGARIAGISNLTIAPNLALGANSARRATWTLYAAGFFSLLMAIVGIVGVTMTKAESKVKKLLRSSSFSLPPFNTRGEAKAYVESAFAFTTSKERAPVHSLLDSLPEVPPFGTTHRDAITHAIEQMIESATPNLPIAIIVFAIAIMGGWYIFTNI